MKNISIHTQYSSLFGRKPPPLEKIMPKEVSYNLLIALSFLSYSDQSGYLKDWCLHNLKLNKNGKIHIEKSKIIKQPSNLILWLHILNKKIKNDDYTKFKIDKYLALIISTSSIINEQEHIGENEAHYLINNLLFNYRDNSLCQFYRSIKIFLNSPCLNKYLDDFKIKNNVSLEEFIYVCHAINVQYLQYKQASDWILDIDTFAKETGFDNNLVRKVIKLISFTYEEGKKYISSEVWKNYDFNFFSNTPFICINEEKYIPVDGKFSENLVFNNLFHRIKNSSNKKQSFMIDFGFAFEKYVADLTEYACKNSTSFKYEFIPEFMYGVENKRSSDSFIHFSDEIIGIDTVLVIEVKSAKILDSVKRLESDGQSIQKSINKLSISPLEQQIKSVCNIINCNAHPQITSDKVYYFMSVSMDDFPLLIGGWKTDININFKEPINIKTGGFFSLSIEEFELFIKLISANIDCSFSHILEKYRTEYNEYSIKTYLARLEKRSKFCNKSFEEMILQSQNRVFNFLQRDKTYLTKENA